MIEPAYGTIAVASAFSPRFEQVLAEAKRVRDRLGARLNLIYVGKCDENTTKRFREAFSLLQLPSDSTIHYQEAEDPAAAILEAARANNVELLIAGALEKEVVLRPFLGNVARRLVREASCSVMLFTRPERHPKPMRRIVFIADYSEEGTCALQKTLQLAAKENCEKLYVIRVYTTFDEKRATLRASVAEKPDDLPARTLEEEEVALEQFIDAAGHSDVPMEARCIRGNTGYAASDFVQAVEADLLVVPVEGGTDKGELPAHIAWVTDVIPCNLWVIR